MKKLLYFILLIMIAAIIFFIVKKNMKVTYMTITERGVTVDIPEDLETTTYDEWRMFSDQSSFYIGVASIAAMNEVTSMDEIMPYFKEWMIYGYIEELGHKFTVPLSNSMSNIILTDYSVERINGIEVGTLEISFDQNGGNKSNRMSGKFQFVFNEDHFILILISTERNKEEKYQEIVDHVINSIKIQ